MLPVQEAQNDRALSGLQRRFTGQGDMKYSQAVKIAIECMKETHQKLAVAANLYELYKLEDAQGIEASRRRKLIKEAEQTLLSSLDLNGGNEKR